MQGRADLIRPHGGYRSLKAYQLAEFIHDGTVAFCRLYVSSKSRTVDQMVQAARSGKQNIAEGSLASGTSKKTELNLISVARASLEELLADYEDFLRQQHMEAWGKDHDKAKFIRAIATRPGRSYSTYKPYIEEKGAENAANTLICLIRQASYLLDNLRRRLERQFVEEGGFSERLYKERRRSRESRSDH